MNKRAVVSIAGLFAVALLVVRGAAGTVEAARAATAAEPRALQVLAASSRPRAGRDFAGVAVVTLEEGARLYKVVRSWCTSARIRMGPSRTVSVPVRIARLVRDPDEGGPAREVTTCTWQVPAGVRGKRMVANVIDRLVAMDGTGSLGSQTVEWVVR